MKSNLVKARSLFNRLRSGASYGRRYTLLFDMPDIRDIRGISDVPAVLLIVVESCTSRAISKSLSSISTLQAHMPQLSLGQAKTSKVLYVQ